MASNQVLEAEREGGRERPGYCIDKELSKLAKNIRLEL